MHISSASVRLGKSGTLSRGRGLGRLKTIISASPRAEGVSDPACHGGAGATPMPLPGTLDRFSADRRLPSERQEWRGRLSESGNLVVLTRLLKDVTHFPTEYKALQWGNRKGPLKGLLRQFGRRDLN